MLLRVNILEAYDIPNDFINHKHDQKSHAKKVIQHLYQNSEVHFTAIVEIKNLGISEYTSDFLTIQAFDEYDSLNNLKLVRKYLSKNV